MAAFFNVFITTDRPAEVTAQSVSSLLGSELIADRSDDGTTYRAYLLGVELALFDNHGLEIDRDMDFTRYAIEVDVGPLAGKQYQDDFVSALAINLAWQLNSKLGFATMVTRDLQRIIHRFGS